MGAAIPTVAYLAEHRLFVKRPDRPSELIESSFAEQIFERDTERRQRQGWRGGTPLWQSMGRGEQLGMLPPIDDVRPIAFTSVARAAQPGELMYIMHVGAMGSLMHYKLDEAYERRLVHRQKYEISDIAVHPTQNVMACCVQYDDGSCNLARGEREGRKLAEITSGDSRDESPSWAPGPGLRVVFQTAGVGRNPQGLRGGLGPYHIARLDLENGELTTLHQDDGFDLLNPRLSAAGELYYIRRPYDPRPTPVGPLTVLKDAALFPFRLARAIVHFFNAFSMMFSGKPLYTAGGPKEAGPDAARLMLWGRYIEAQQSQRRMAMLSERPLVPASWQLCVRTPDGREDTIASHVLSFDLCEDGGVVYTTGARLIHRSPDGIETLLDKGRMIHKLAVVS
jgi:hypothetical protein